MANDDDEVENSLTATTTVLATGVSAAAEVGNTEVATLMACMRDKLLAIDAQGDKLKIWQIPSEKMEDLRNLNRLVVTHIHPVPKKIRSQCPRY